MVYLNGGCVFSAAASQSVLAPDLTVCRGCLTTMLRTSIIVGIPSHGLLGPHIGGTYLPSGENHGKPVYQKTIQHNGLDTFLYFWDARDGPELCGWWFGPSVGNNVVWAFHGASWKQLPPRVNAIPIIPQYSI